MVAGSFSRYFPGWPSRSTTRYPYGAGPPRNRPASTMRALAAVTREKMEEASNSAKDASIVARTRSMGVVMSMDSLTETTAAGRGRAWSNCR